MKDKISKLKVCVLQPDYSTTNVDYKNYDPPRDLCSLLPEAEVHHVFLNKLTTYKQLKALSREGFDIFVNLCEGYLDWEVPSIDVIQSLDLLNLPYTGPSTLLYDPPKPLMKYVAYTAGVNCPTYLEISDKENLNTFPSEMTFPLFIKPSKAGDSLGVDAQSLTHSIDELVNKIKNTDDGYFPLMAEQYIAGREFTVLVAATQLEPIAFLPVEYIFPEGYEFKSYDLKTSVLHVDANIACADELLASRLKNAALSIFKAFNGEGYARLDFRVNAASEIYFLEINFTCSVFYDKGYEGSADYILKLDGFGREKFLKLIIEEGMLRHLRKQKKFKMQGNSIAGYGIFASTQIKRGEVIFKGEGMAQRIATKRHVETNWSLEGKKNFAQYAYPVSDEVYILWDSNPAEWAPQNHSCNANTAYNGLNVVALRDIGLGEELTLNYAEFLDDRMESFNCNCKSNNCNGTIFGEAHNTITSREQRISEQSI